MRHAFVGLAFVGLLMAGQGTAKAGPIVTITETFDVSTGSYTGWLVSDGFLAVGLGFDLDNLDSVDPFNAGAQLLFGFIPVAIAPPLPDADQFSESFGDAYGATLDVEVGSIDNFDEIIGINIGFGLQTFTSGDINLFNQTQTFSIPLNAAALAFLNGTEGFLPVFITAPSDGDPNDCGWQGCVDTDDYWFRSATLTAVPEPGSLLLFGTALIGLGMRFRRKMSR